MSTSIFYGCSKNSGGPTSGTNMTNEVKDVKEDSKGMISFSNVEPNVKSADEALNLLKEGNERFASDKSQLRNINEEKRDQLKEGQSPYAVIVSCSDSRVTPSAIFNKGLGELFEIRIAGNVVDNNALGSIEYAVEHLNTPLIVIIGHESCGAVTATYDSVVKKETVEGKISSIVKKIKPSIDEKGTIDDAIHKNVDSVVNEISNNEIIKHLIGEDKVKVVGAYYNLEGKVEFK